jgi:uncharacterized membrane protein YcaP (DUF421 family)
METVNDILGTGKELTALQMSVRAFIFFFITLIYLRIAGIRTLGKKSMNDMIIVIVLGSVVARGIAGASGFGPTIASSFVLVLLHRFISWLTCRSRAVEKMIKGEKLLLFENGSYIKKNMERANITEHDFSEALRLSTQQKDNKKVVAAFLETNGELSFILNDNE